MSARLRTNACGSVEPHTAGRLLQPAHPACQPAYPACQPAYPACQPARLSSLPTSPPIQLANQPAYPACQPATHACASAGKWLEMRGSDLHHTNVMMETYQLSS
eukprot:365891-Chlamydomonas_euryale.AAC.3